MMEKNFMVDPSVINKRKTTMVEGGRIRDHKIQVKQKHLNDQKIKPKLVPGAKLKK